MTRFISGVIIASILMFIWGAMFWGFGIGAPFTKMTLAQETEVIEVLKATGLQSGSYQMPDYELNPDQEAALAAYRAGPIAMLHVNAIGAEPGGPATLLKGYLHMLLTVLLIATLLAVLKLERFLGRFVLVVGIGLIGALWAQAANPIWFHHPWTYYVWTAAYDLIAFSIAGAVLAFFVRPRTSSPY